MEGVGVGGGVGVRVGMGMGMGRTTASAPLLLLVASSLVFVLPTAAQQQEEAPPEPTPWPLQFHSILLANASGNRLSVIDLWYDHPNGRNFNIIQKQLGELLYDAEWDNGTSFYYTLDDPTRCSTLRFPVGILRPNWMEGAHYLGQETFDAFLCNVWTKAHFIVYYEDALTKRPVHWLFTSTGRSINVMTFEVGEVLEDEKWQAPPYCFNGEGEKISSGQVVGPEETLSLRNLWKGLMMPSY